MERKTTTSELLTIFKDVLGFEGYYLISDLGNLRCVLKNRLMKVYIHTAGYEYIYLRLNGVKHKRYIHRLVAEAFIPNPENKPQVNHIDGDKTNNKLSNLEWVTSSENHKHRYDVLGHRSANKGKKYESGIPINQFDLNGNLLNTFLSCTHAADILNDGTDLKGISKCLRGVSKTHNGYIFKRVL